MNEQVHTVFVNQLGVDEWYHSIKICDKYEILTGTKQETSPST